MAKKTVLRQANTQEITNITEKMFATYQFTGINDSDNYTDVDQYSFADANNVFVDGDNRLSTRPPLKTIVMQDFDVNNVVDVQKVDDVIFYILKDNSIHWKYNNTWWSYVLDSFDSIKIFSYDNYFLFFVLNGEMADIKAIKYNYDNNLFDEYDANDLIYIPATSIHYGTTITDEVESKNLLTDKCSVRYIFNSSINTPSKALIGETVTIRVDGNTYEVVWKEEYATQMPTKIGLIRDNKDNVIVLETFFEESTMIVKAMINDENYILYSFNGDVWGRIEYPVDYNDYIKFTLSKDGTELWLFDFDNVVGNAGVDSKIYYLTLPTDIADLSEYSWSSLDVTITLNLNTAYNYNHLIVYPDDDDNYEACAVGTPVSLNVYTVYEPSCQIYSREAGNCIIMFTQSNTCNIAGVSLSGFSSGDTVTISNITNSGTSTGSAVPIMFLFIVDEYQLKNADYYDGTLLNLYDKMVIAAVDSGSTQKMINVCGFYNNSGEAWFQIQTIYCTVDWTPVANYSNEKHFVKTCLPIDHHANTGPYAPNAYVTNGFLYDVPTFIGDTIEDVITKLEYAFQSNYNNGVFIFNLLTYYYGSSGGKDIVYNASITNPDIDTYVNHIAQFFTNLTSYEINADDVTALTSCIEVVGDVFYDDKGATGDTALQYTTIYEYDEGEYSLSHRFYIINYIRDYLSVNVITDKYYYSDHVIYNYIAYELNPDIVIHAFGIDANGKLYYYDEDNYVYNNLHDEDWYVDYLDTELQNTIIIPSFIDAFITHTFVYNNLLYQTNNMTMEDDNCLLYIPENTKVTLPDTITGTVTFSQTVLALFTEHTAYEYTYDDETGYFQLYPTKLQLGNRKDYDICIAFDGLTIYLVTVFGYKSLTYESFIQSTEQAFTDCCENIYNKFIEFDDAPIKQAKYNYWIFSYKQGDNNILVYDTRQNLDDYYNPLYPKWFRWTLPCSIEKLYYDGRDCYVFTGDTVYLLDFTSTTVTELGEPIDWFIRSQKLHFSYPAYYKHISNFTVLTSQASDARYKLKFINYHNAYDTEHIDTKEYQIETIGACIKRVNFLKTNALQFEISNDDTDKYPKKFVISGINIKYRITENVR